MCLNNVLQMCELLEGILHPDTKPLVFDKSCRIASDSGGPSEPLMCGTLEKKGRSAALANITWHK